MNRIAFFLVAALAVSMLSGCEWLSQQTDEVTDVMMDGKEVMEPVEETSTASITIDEQEDDVVTSEASIEIVGGEDPDEPLMMDDEMEKTEASIEIKGMEEGEVPSEPLGDSME